MMFRHHALLMTRLDVQESLLQQVLVECSQRRKRMAKMQTREAPQRPKEGIEEAEGEEVAPKFSTKASSVKLSSYTSEDLERKESAGMIHAKQAMVKFANNVSRGVHAVHATTESYVKRLVGHVGFEAFFALVVVSNAIFIGIDVHYSTSVQGPRPVSYKVVQYTYTTLFVAELFLRMYAHGWKFFANDDWMWSLLDVFIVVTSLWEVAVDVVQAIYEGQGQIDTISGLTNMKSFRIIRLTRLLKTVQFVRIFRFVMALRMLVTSIISTLKALFWALILLGLIIYVFAVLFTQAVYDHNTDTPLPEPHLSSSKHYWGSLSKSMLSLFMSIANGVSWEEAVAPLEAISSIWVFAFLFYIAFTYFAVLNVVTGVFCQSAIESAQNDHAMVVQSMIDNKTAHLNKIRQLFSEIGAEESGVLTLGVFEEKIKSPAVRQYFEALGLDVWDAWSFFKLLDTDGGGSVEIEEFFMGCLKFRGGARSMDVGKILQDQKWLINNQGKLQSYLTEELTILKEELALIGEMLEASAKGEVSSH